MPEAELHSVEIGITRSGKSQGKRVDISRVAKRRKFAQLICDGKGSMVEQIAGDLAKANFPFEYEVLDPAYDGKHLGWPFLRASLASDLSVRENEDHLFREQFQQPLWSTYDMKDGKSSPWKLKYMDAATEIMQGLSPRPINKMLKIFNRDDPDGQRMILETTNRAAAQVFRDLFFRSVGTRQRYQWDTECGAAMRMMDPLKSSVVWKRSMGSFDWRRALLDKRTILLNGRNVPRDIRRFIFIMATNEVITQARAHYNETGQPLPVIIVLDEAGADDLVTPLVLTAMQEMAEAGIRIQVMSQSIMDFGDTDKFERLISNAQQIRFYRLTSGAERAAQILANPTFDPHAIHHSDEVAYTAGYQEVATAHRSVDADGHTERVSHGTAYRPYQEVRVVNHYKTPQQHESEFKRDVTTLPMTDGQPRERFVSDYQGVRREQITMLPEPWGMGLTKIRTKKAIDLTRSREHYQRWTPSQAPAEPPSLQAIADLKIEERRDATGELIGE